MAGSLLSLWCPNIPDDRLTRLVEWCDRYSPLVSQDGRDGIILDITGCAHLFGGEGPLFLDLQHRLQRMGIESHSAIADTWGAAWALARYSDKRIVHGENILPALDPLPVEALRLPDPIAPELRRLGLITIAAVRKIPRHSLSVRFGPALLRRLDQALQKAEDPLTPWRPPAAYRACRILAEPVSTVSSVEYVLRDLLQEICGRLEKDHLGSRHMNLACYRVDGTVDRCDVHTSRPNRAIPHLLRLFGERLEKLRADFGFETFILSAPDVEALPPAQLSFAPTHAAPSEAPEDEDSFDALVDRLGMRLGFQEVNRIRIRESYLPDHAVEFRPVIAPVLAGAEWSAYRVRPIRLIDPPMPIEVSVLIPGGIPVRFFIGQQEHRVVRSEGPERLTAEWWREPAPRWRMRDYYRVENDKGFRFWIYCDDPSPVGRPARRWFLHGHFA